MNFSPEKQTAPCHGAGLRKNDCFFVGFNVTEKKKLNFKQDYVFFACALFFSKLGTCTVIGSQPLIGQEAD